MRLSLSLSLSRFTYAAVPSLVINTHKYTQRFTVTPLRLRWYYAPVGSKSCGKIAGRSRLSHSLAQTLSYIQYPYYNISVSSEMRTQLQRRSVTGLRKRQFFHLISLLFRLDLQRRLLLCIGRHLSPSCVYYIRCVETRKNKSTDLPIVFIPLCTV